MKELTCMVIGGGYAGINAVKEIYERFKDHSNKYAIRLILIDKNSYHLRKVLLFKPAAQRTKITVPLKKVVPKGVECIKATVLKIESKEKVIHVKATDGKRKAMEYDILVLAIGSIVRQPEQDQGGIALTCVDNALKIQDMWKVNLKKATTVTNMEERRTLMTIAVAGAGISGIETSAELAHYIRKDAKHFGLDPHAVQVLLLNANKRLFLEGPTRMGDQLERALHSSGVKVIHGVKVLQEKDRMLTLSNGEVMSVGLCVWTLGLLPNPVLQNIGLPVSSEGYIIVDSSYRVPGADGIYCIGDCAHIIHPVSGKVDGKTCKEATAQATRLGKVLKADMLGKKAPTHRSMMDLFCFSLGPEKGLLWMQKWGIHFTFTGKLGWKIRTFTWDSASLLKNSD